MLVMVYFDKEFGEILKVHFYFQKILLVDSWGSVL